MKQGELPASIGAVHLAGKSIIATAESRGLVASYAYLTTPDRVQSVVVPANSILMVDFSADVNFAGAAQAIAAIFIGGVQLQALDAPTAAYAVQAARGGTNFRIRVRTAPVGLVAHTMNSTTIPTAPTTGVAGGVADVASGGVYDPGARSVDGGVAGVPCAVHGLAAGTYDVGVQWQASAAQNLTASNRRLFVWTMEF